ncbi:hypothetical protein WMY93_018135 [Mugilogobius chulae]|uniref:Uncharacterized protein n=1 Tax=Mugilogobius chulae TaxID=88201 RepID=A0AAW0NUS8_9GOBI
MPLFLNKAAPYLHNSALSDCITVCFPTRSSLGRRAVKTICQKRRQRHHALLNSPVKERKQEGRIRTRGNTAGEQVRSEEITPINTDKRKVKQREETSESENVLYMEKRLNSAANITATASVFCLELDKSREERRARLRKSMPHQHNPVLDKHGAQKDLGRRQAPGSGTKIN